jgi:hypothetical protein
MILLEILFFRHYVSAVVQTASKPYPTRERITLIVHETVKEGTGMRSVWFN